MKYILQAIWYCFMIICFIFAVTAQFLWDFKKPTVKLTLTIEKGNDFLENWGNNNEYCGY